MDQGHTPEPLLTLNRSGLSTRHWSDLPPGPRALDRALGPRPFLLLLLWVERVCVCVCAFITSSLPAPTLPHPHSPWEASGMRHLASDRSAQLCYLGAGWPQVPQVS